MNKVESLFKLDARRLLCPMPVIRTQNRIKELKAGDKLEITCTDPGALSDIPSWCRIFGHTVLSTNTVDREIFILIQVNETS
jgi:tRNA 2-thiouridine synthesizing protein A